LLDASSFIYAAFPTPAVSMADLIAAQTAFEDA